MIALLRPKAIISALPNNIQNGQTADAVPLMADLNHIVNQVNANAQQIGLAALLAAANTFTLVQSGIAATAGSNFPIASQVQNNVFNTLTSTLGTNTITTRIAALPLSAHAIGQVFTLIPSQYNTGAVGVTIDATASRSIQNMGSNLTGTELRTGVPLFLFDDGTNINLIGGPQYVQGPDVPSGATLNLDGSFGDYHHVGGTTAISAVTLSRGRQRTLVFDSSPVYTNGASLKLLGATNRTPIAGDVSVLRGESGGIVREVGGTYLPASAGGSLVLLGSKTASASATISFAQTGGTGDVLFDWTAFDVIVFRFVRVIPVTDNVFIQAQISENSGASFLAGASTYFSLQIETTAIPGGPTASTQNTNLWNLNNLGVSNASPGMSGEMTMYRPGFTGSNKEIKWDWVMPTPTSSLTKSEGVGQYSGDTAGWSGVKFFASSGNISSGTIYAYGIKRA